MVLLNAEENNIFRNWQKLDGVQFVTIVSAKTGYPYTTPVNFVLFGDKFYTSIDTNAAKVRFLREGSKKMNITFSINGTARKPYFGMVGTGLIIEDNQTLQAKFLLDLDDIKLAGNSSNSITKQLRQWIDNEERITLEFTPKSVYGKTRGAI